MTTLTKAGSIATHVGDRIEEIALRSSIEPCEAISILEMLGWLVGFGVYFHSPSSVQFLGPLLAFGSFRAWFFCFAFVWFYSTVSLLMFGFGWKTQSWRIFRMASLLLSMLLWIIVACLMSTFRYFIGTWTFLLFAGVCMYAVLRVAFDFNVESKVHLLNGVRSKVDSILEEEKRNGSSGWETN